MNWLDNGEVLTSIGELFAEDLGRELRAETRVLTSVRRWPTITVGGS